MPQYLKLISALYDLQHKSEGTGKNHQVGPARASLATLKSGFSRGHDNNYRAYPIISPYIQEGDGDRSIRAALLLASLFAMHERIPQKKESENPYDDPSFGTVLKQLSDGNEEAMERRFLALLDADPEDVPTHIQWLVRMAANKKVDICWKRLSLELPKLLDPNRAVGERTRLNWSRDFWKKPPKDSENGEDE